MWRWRTFHQNSFFNWDQTVISIVPGSSWTMEMKDSKRVETVGISDKRQITAVLCCTLAGESLPCQLIYQGKTTACLPQHKFPSDWHVTYMPNHWSNEEKMKEYLKEIIIPYVEWKRKDLQLTSNHPALVLFDVFKGQQTDSIAAILEENNALFMLRSIGCRWSVQLQVWGLQQKNSDSGSGKPASWKGLHDEHPEVYTSENFSLYGTWPNTSGRNCNTVIWGLHPNW